MAYFARFIHAIRGPNLYRIFQNGTELGRNYEPNTLESGASKVISTIRFCLSFSYWTSPLLMGILYRRGHFTTEGLVNIGKVAAYIGTIYFTAFLVRGIGRSLNPDYLTFITVLTNAQRVFNEQNKRLLAGYDFECWARPIDFRWADVNTGEAKKVKVQSDSYQHESGSFFTMPTDILSYMCAHTFGRRMVYPGATALINTLVEAPLCQGRAKLVEEMGGLRAKLLTEDKNEIDTMFVDRRNTNDLKGKTLVVCCEGNAGFYEIGAMATPLDLGYSVIGWNHPGFAGSSGVPFPEQEQCAIDAVMQYAIHKLDFMPDNIVLYAWSIGGYTASWAAMNYPDAKFVILDATFDELIPLALAKMPEFATGLVKTTVKRYLNLDIASQLIKYEGPILLIRRSKDEMITTRDPSAIDTNRGNFLLKKLLLYRYPDLIHEETLDEYLSKDKAAQAIMMSGQDTIWCETAIKSHRQTHQPHGFPLTLGVNTPQEKVQMTFYLASRYVEDFDSTHCTPLPATFFRKPYSEF